MANYIKGEQKGSDIFRCVISLGAVLVLWPGVAVAQGDAATASANPSVERAWSFTGEYTADTLSDVDGGDRRGTRYLDKTAASVAFDGNAAGLDGLSAMLSANYTNGTAFSTNLVGDAHGVSNIEAPGAARINEAWMAHDFLGTKGHVKIGIIDLNTEFDTLNSSALFINSAHGIGSEFSHTGLNGPSIFPFTTLGMTTSYQADRKTLVRVGVFNGVAGNPADPGQVAYRVSANNGALAIGQLERNFRQFRVEAAVWGYTARFDALDQVEGGANPIRVGGNMGGYALIEGPLYSAPSNSERTLSGWIRAGVANGRINPVNRYLGAGLVYTGFLTGTGRDQLGLAAAYGGFSRLSRIGASDNGGDLGPQETNVELTYQYQVKKWLFLQPDVQYVISPGGDPLYKNAIVAGLRFDLKIQR